MRASQRLKVMSEAYPPASRLDNSRGRRAGGRTALLAAGLLATGCAAFERQGEVPVPQRPTLSQDTRTTEVGTVEMEAGAAFDDDDNYALPLLFKYGLDPRTDVQVGGDLLRHLDDPIDETGIGDLVLGIKHRFGAGDEGGPAYAGLGTIKLPTADEDDGLGTGEIDLGLAGIVDVRVDEFDVTGFYRLGLLGDRDDGGLDIGHQLAVAAQRPLDGRITAYGELAGVFQPEDDYESVFTTLGLQWTQRIDTVWDVGLAIGLSDDAPDAALLFGVTRNFGRP